MNLGGPLVAAPCCSWLLLAFAGSSWVLLGPPGSSWDLLGFPGSSWDILGPPGSSWDPWVSLGPPGFPVKGTHGQVEVYTFGLHGAPQIKSGWAGGSSR